MIFRMGLPKGGLEESVVRRIIPRLKEAGAEGIVEFPLNKIVM